MASTTERGRSTPLEHQHLQNKTEQGSFLWYDERPKGYVPERFDLIFPFENTLPHLVKKHEALPKKEKRQAIRKELVAILASQYQDWLREEIRMPIHDQRYLEVEIDEHGTCFLWNRKLYPHGDILHQCRSAVEQAVKETYKERFQKELEQTEMLVATMQAYMDSAPHAIVKFLADQPERMAAETEPSDWLPYTGKLPEDLLAQRPTENPPVFVGEKQLFILPQNLQVYPDNSALWATWQLTYVPWLPEGKKYVVLIHQYLNFLPMTDHAALLDKAGIPVPTATEQELMSRTTALGTQYRQLDSMQTFSGLLQETDNLLHKNIAVDYQERLGTFDRYAKTLPKAAEFLADVFLDELDRLQRLWKQGIDEPLPADALKAAHSIVMNTFIQSQPFDLDASKTKYNETYNPMTRGRYTSAQDYAQLQNTFIENLSKTESMWHVINRVSSVTQCAAGSFGGLSRVAEMANNASFMQGMGLPAMSSGELMSAIQDRSHEFSKDQIAQLIGKERFDANFSRGVCINCGHEDWTGECKVCWRCELSWGAQNYGERYAQDKNAPSTTAGSSDSQPTYAGRAGADAMVQLLGGHRPETVFASPFLSSMAKYNALPLAG